MIEVAGLTKRFGDLVAVDELSFTAPTGGVTAILGPNGAGKTTTFRVLLGLARPTAGRALIEGRPYEELERPRQTVGAVLESSGFHPARTGRDHLRVVATAAGIPRSRVDELLAFVGLERAADRRVGGYSTGMRQRLAVAGALLCDPPVVVLDEPTSGLDPEGGAWVRRLLREVAAEGRCVPLARALTAQHGVQVSATGDGRLVVRGATAEDVGRTAARVGATVFELSSRSAGESLEQLYLSLIGPEEREVG